LTDQNKTIGFIFVLDCDNVLYNTLWALKISAFLPGVFAEAMEKLTGYLFGLGEAFHDAVQNTPASWSITMASDPDGQQLAFSRVPEVAPAAIFAPTPKAPRRSLEFFTNQVNNDHTRKAYPKCDAPIFAMVR